MHICIYISYINTHIYIYIIYFLYLYFIHIFLITILIILPLILFKDEKYEKLKGQFFQDQRNFKILREKYINLRNEKEMVQEKLLEMRSTRKMQNNKRSCTMKTTIDSNSTPIHSSSTGYNTKNIYKAIYS